MRRLGARGRGRREEGGDVWDEHNELKREKHTHTTHARDSSYKTQNRKERPARGVEAESQGWAPYLEGT